MKTKTHHAKPASDIEKRSVSAPIVLFAEADRRAEKRRMNNFSEYVRDLIRRDVEGNLLTQTEREAA